MKKYRLPFFEYNAIRCRSVLEGCPSRIIRFTKFEEMVPTRVAIEFLDPMDEAIFLSDFYEGYKNDLSVSKQVVNAKSRKLTATWNLITDDVVDTVYNDMLVQVASKLDQDVRSDFLIPADTRNELPPSLYHRLTQVPSARIADVVERSERHLHVTRAHRYLGVQQSGRSCCLCHRPL